VLINGERSVNFEVSTTGTSNGSLFLRDESDFICEDFTVEITAEDSSLHGISQPHRIMSLLRISVLYSSSNILFVSIL